MPYKDKEKGRELTLKSYYRNREKRIRYQKQYDKKNKERKRLQDKKRYKTKEYNKKQYVRHYSQKNHYPILKDKYNGCQLCGSKEKLEIHHIRYTKGIKDCLLLCQNCHKKIHRRKAYSKIN